MASYQHSWNGKRRSLSGWNRAGGHRWAQLAGFFGFLRGRSFTHTAIKVTAFLAVIFFAFGLAAFAYYSQDLPDPDKLSARIVPESTKIYDRNGELLYDIFGEARRTMISWDDIPDNVKHATVAIEDKDFYKHKGISFVRIISSAIHDVLTLSRTQGASTITQQLIKNAFLSNEKLFSRKIKEMVLAVQIERKYGKDEILKMYLNEIPYGSNVYGVQAAAQTFFGKDAKNLTLAEAAYLAALPQAPSRLLSDRQRLDDRKNIVLRLMEEQGYITNEQREAAKAEKVVFSPVKNSIKAPHFVLYVQDLLAQKYGEKTLQEGGLQVTTTLDMKLQKFAEDSIKDSAEKNEKSYGATNASLVAIDPTNGQILAMVGSRNFFDEGIDGQVNVALSPRQPGSSFKPYVYATAFKQGWAPASLLMDVTTNFGNFGGQDYTPHNYSGKNYGPVSIRQALAGSLNVPAVKMILLVGVKSAIDTAHDMGITTLQDESRFGPSLVLGGGEVKLLDHTSAFATFASGGIRRQPTPILSVKDAKGNTLEEFKQGSGQQVIDPQVAYLTTSILSDNSARSFIFGPRNYLTLPDRPVAAKTGTTQEYHDAWTIGFTPQIATGVWVGNSDNAKMKPGADGSVVAAPIWNSFMKKAHQDLPVQPFSRPPGIQDITVDSVSGKLPTNNTPSTKTDVFASFALPSQPDDVHLSVKIDRTTMQPATDSTPSGNIDMRVYTIFHSEKPDDPLWEDPVRAWAIASGYAYPDASAIYTGTDVSSGSNIGNGKNIYITMPEPAENDIITDLPLKVTVQASSEAGVKAITMFFDGKQVFSNASATATFYYSDVYPDGDHVIRIRVENISGDTAEIARHVVYHLNQNIILRKPQDKTQLAFPVQMLADARRGTSNAAFYYQRAGSTAKKIPGNVNKDENEFTAQFSLTWASADKPKSGAYEVWAQTDTGEKSNIMRVTVP